MPCREPVLPHPCGRLVHWFVGQLERTPVRSGNNHPLAVLCGCHLSDCLYAIVRIHVDSSHKPTWLVGADWQNRQVKWPELPGNRAEFGMKGRVAGEENRSILTAKRPAAPQGLIASAKCSA